MVQGLLKEERESTEDLEYWIDYIHLFGIAHKIPKYDHMNFIRFHNIDVFAAFFIILYLLYRLIKVCICKCCCCCCRKSKEDEKLK